MIADRYDVVVVGASVAAEALISQLRTLEYDGSILVIDQDQEMPYERPPLSKNYLIDEDEDFGIEVDWSDLTEIVFAAAIDLDVNNNSVTVKLFGDENTTKNQKVEYGNLVIASGASPIKLPFEPAGVLNLRTKKEAEKIKKSVKKGTRVGIIGAGAIGSELAASLTTLGAEVAIYDMAKGPLDRMLSGNFGDTITEWLTDYGVSCHWGVSITNISKSDNNWVIHFDDGETAEFEVLISAVGVKPNTAWLEKSGILSGNSLICDKDGRALTSSGTYIKNNPIFGIGDVVTTKLNDGSLFRTESWSAAVESGVRLAHLLLKEPAPDLEKPYFWSDIGNKKLQILGYIPKNANFEVEFENPNRGATLYKVTATDNNAEVSWLGVNAQPQIAKLRFS